MPQAAILPVGEKPLDSLTTAQRIQQTTVLIPAAGSVPEGLVALSNIACPAMIPVGGRPVIHWTMGYLRSLGFSKFVIAVARRGMYIEDFVECTFGKDCDVTFIVPTTEGGVGRTIFELANWAGTESALVVLGDTHFQFLQAQEVCTDEPAVLVREVEDSDRWCIADLDDNGYVKSLHDKEPNLSAPRNALIGVYYFPRVEALRLATQQAVKEAERLGKRTELSAILNRIAAKDRIRALPAGDWLDCGNPDRQASSHRTLLQKREFNELTIDSVFGTVTKRSRNVDKFIDEINYLRLLPPELAVLFPRVLSYSTSWDDPYVTMEYYGYPTLGEAFVFENVNPSVWEQVFRHLREVIVRGFMPNKKPLAASVVRQMYLHKTRERIDSLPSGSQLAKLIASPDPVEINGRKMLGINQRFEQIAQDVEALAQNVKGCVIHGDLCLSNVLYDLRSRIIKLLDPRGSFASAGIYGDPRYDVAKLYHSVFGHYDFIVNDLFHVSLDGNKIELDIRTRPQHEEIRQRFEQVFFADFDRNEVLLITALLFASMPSLHYDSPRRQLAMYAKSLQLLDELYGGPNHRTLI